MSISRDLGFRRIAYPIFGEYQTAFAVPVRFLTSSTGSRFIDSKTDTFIQREGCPAAAPGPVR